jgi:hypothetical protein
MLTELPILLSFLAKIDDLELLFTDEMLELILLMEDVGEGEVALLLVLLKSNLPIVGEVGP